MASEPEIERRLRAVPAHNQLAKIFKLRAVNDALKPGWPQRRIAEEIGVGQPEASHLADTAQFTPQACERTREVLLEYAVGTSRCGVYTVAPPRPRS